MTGCTTGGIEFHLCEEFAEKGCIVYATSRRLETMQGFQHDTIRTMALDVTKDEDITAVVQKIFEEQGKIDVVVNNAGALAIGPVAEATIEQIRNAFELTQHLCRSLRHQRDRTFYDQTTRGSHHQHWIYCWHRNDTMEYSVLRRQSCIT